MVCIWSIPVLHFATKWAVWTGEKVDAVSNIQEVNLSSLLKVK